MERRERQGKESRVWIKSTVIWLQKYKQDANVVRECSQGGAKSYPNEQDTTNLWNSLLQDAISTNAENLEMAADTSFKRFKAN